MDTFKRKGFAITTCLIVALATVTAGCGKPREDSYNKPPPRSGMSLVIEDLTGKTDVKAGQRSQETIRRVSNKEQQDLNEVLEK